MRAAWAVALLAALMTALLPAPAANAAGPAVVDVEITAVDYATGLPQTTAAYNTHGNRVAYRVDYSCAVAVCSDATVTITPPQANPYGIVPNLSLLGAWGPNLLTYNTWTAPAGLAGATIGGDDVTGKVVSLGDVPAGTSGSFVVVYAFPATVNRTIIPAQLYPDGFQLIHSATISSPNATGDASATASPVTWNISVPAPSIVLAGPGTVRPDTDVNYQIRMSSGSMGRGGGNIYGVSSAQAAGNHTVTMQLPPEAEYVSATGTPGAVYDSVAHTLTWTEGSEADPTWCAGGGWGATIQNNGYWNLTPPCYTPRNVVLRYPAAAFTSDPSGCNFDANVTPTVRVDVTYLDTARTEKSATASSTTAVSCYDPFGRVNVSKDSTNDGGTYPAANRPVNIPPDVTGLSCDATGYDDWGRACTTGQPLAAFGDNNKYWYVYGYNAGNVPGVITIEDTDLDHPDMPVYQIQASATTPTPTIDYTYQCGSDAPVSDTVTTTSLLLSSLVTGADCRFTSATVTSGAVAAGNVRPQDTGTGARFDVIFRYSVHVGATPGIRTNAATATVSYPDYPELADLSDSASRNVNLRELPKATVYPSLTAGWATAPVVEGGGQAVPGRDVTFSVRGATGNFSGENDYAPQYAFVAPAGWTIQPGSASFASSVPAGATFTYRTTVVDGVTRQIVVASWPDGVTFGENVTLPTMTVVATPTYSVVAGTTSVAHAWIGDSRDIYDNTTMVYTGARQDVGDADGDGRTTDWFSTSAQSILVSSADAVSVIKEICRPDPDAADGCEWLGDPSQAVPVSTTATGIRYRVTIQNTGNTNLTGLVAYDVLPYVGDMGTSNGTASTPRGSTFSESLASIDEQSAGLSLSYSSSTNPPRPEVYGGSTTGDWTASAVGAQAIRAAYGAALAPGASVSFSYSANVGAEATADSIACNSVAIDTDTTVPAEPPAVCALTAEADLEILVPERLPLQAGRPGVLPFTVTNHGGSAQAPATVAVEIPAGVTVTSLTPAGWDCTASGSAPLNGPATLSCVPVNGTGAVTTIALGAVVPLDVPVVVAAATTTLCVPGEVSSRMVDPQLANNETEGCVTVAAFDGALSIDKDDNRTEVGIGDEYSYEIVVSNELVGESLDDVVLTDTLPAGLAFVSASDGGVLSGASADGTGGTVTWPAASLGATGEASEDGDATAGGANTSFTRTVTVRVVSTASGAVVNLARVVASDPADAATPFEETASDTDQLRRLTVTKSNDALPAGVRAGDTVEYTVTLTNSGTVAYTAGDPATLVDDLSALLDDASFVAGSATVELGGSTSPLVDPSGGLLSWSGALGVGASAIVRYSVTVGDGSTGDLSLVNTAYSAGDVSSCADGLDADGLSCASTTTGFAPVLDKRIASLTQGDDGRWTIVYEIDVTSLDADDATVYDLADSLAFGAGITVASAAVTAAPSGIATEPWSGSGPIVSDVTLPAGAVHSYQVVVIADAGQAAGTAGAVCNAGVAGGFANRATLTAEGDNPVTAEVCAAPVAPTVTKTVASPTQQPDGTWLVSYTVTVSNASTTVGGLAYTLDDELVLPSGVDVLDVSVSGPAGAPVNTAFDGSTDTALLSGVDRVPAASSATTPATRVYTVVFHTSVPAGSGTASTFACAPAGTGGYANGVTLYAGTSTTQLAEASACAPIAPLPTPTITKRVVQTSVDAVSGLWTLDYEVVVANPSTQFSTVYTLDDALQFAAAASIESATMTSTDAPVSAGWNGRTQTVAVAGQSLPAGASDVFAVTVVVDASAIDAESAAADCRIDAGETGTGYRNLATVTSGVASAFAVACEPATDPSVVKTTVGAPTQDATTGVWTLVYEVEVTNRSTTSVAGGIPYSIDDALDFPTGVDVVGVTATSDGGTVNGGFDGVDDTTLGAGSIEAAIDDTTPAQHTFIVTVQFRVQAGIDTGLECSTTDETGGLLNVAEITVGSRVSGATACAEVPDVPLPGVTKTVLDQEQQADGTWLLLYRITVGNPSASAVVAYDLDDELAFGAGIDVVGSPSIVAAPAGVSSLVNPDWDGAADISLVEDILLPAGGSHSYTVRVVADSGTLRGTDTAADCVIDGAETGTGFLNRAIVGSAVAQTDAEACARIFDPAVTKQVSGQPTQQADGSWLVSYTMTVSNPSAIELSYGLEDELDYPAGAAVTVESASARAGGPAVVAGWNGNTQLQFVAEGTPLPASAVHVFDVTLRVVFPAGQGSVANAFSNTATVESGAGGVVRTDADATADLLVPELEIVKNVTADAVPRIGATVSYEIVVSNVGQGAYTALYPAVVWDDLAGVVDDASIDGPMTATPNVGTVGADADRTSWRGPLASGASVTLEYTVTVTGGGDAVLHNVAFGAPASVTDPATPDEVNCDAADNCASTRTALPAVHIAKSASVSSTTAGGVVEYTVQLTNTGEVDLPLGDPATFTDDLTGVLDDARYQGDARADTGTVDVTGTTLSWTGALAAGATATVRYSVRVADPMSGDAMLVNLATVDPTLPTLALSLDAPSDRTVSTRTSVLTMAETGVDVGVWALGLTALLLLAAGGAGVVVARRLRRSEG